jgi:ribonuclease BN (tRNA processing enzyme)
MPVYKSQNRLRILGYEGARSGLGGILTSQMESPFFPIKLHEVPANIRIEELKGSEFKLGAFKVEAFTAFHPGTCVGYRLSCGGRSLVFFPDNELKHGACDPTPVAEQVRASTRKETQRLEDFVRGADLLIMDTQYDREEYKEHLGWGHGCVDEVVMLALQAQVQQLFLFHHDPDHDDAKISQMVQEARELVASQKGALKVDAAREGLTVELPLRGA